MNEENKKIYDQLSEHEHQRELFSWAACACRYGLEAACLWASQHPQTLKRQAPVSPVSEDRRLRWLHAIPNGGSRGGDARGRAIAGARLKAEGVKPGVPDVCLPLPQAGYHGLYLELKATKGRLSDEQADCIAYLRGAGYRVCVCTGYRDAICAILSYLDEAKLGQKFFT